MKSNLAITEPELPDAEGDRRDALESIASDLAGLERQAMMLDDEPLALVIATAWQQAASRLLKMT